MKHSAYSNVFISEGSLGGVKKSVLVRSIWVGGGILILSGGPPFWRGCCRTGSFRSCRDVVLMFAIGAGSILVGWLFWPLETGRGWTFWLWWVGGRLAGAPTVSLQLCVCLLELVATRTARECNVATVSFLCFPSMLPTPSAVISSSSPASIHLTGAVRNIFSAPGPAVILRQSRTCWSKTGNFPHSKSSPPPYFFGMSAMSIKDDNVGRTWWWERMNIFEVVMGSNHFLIQPQTVGKKDGAPII